MNHQDSGRDDCRIETSSDAAEIVTGSSSKPWTTKAKQKKANRARHRLRSIHRDAQTIPSVREKLITTFPYIDNWPIVANERCGSWYVPSAPITPEPTQNNPEPSSTYFKSTDGHVGTWAFSLKRLNLHLLEYFFHASHDDSAAGTGIGCFLVDSSLRKVWPDSCSRTLPMWAAVINRIVARYRHDFGFSTFSCDSAMDWDTKLYTPDEMVSREEHDAMEELLDERVETLYQSGAVVDPHRLVERLVKPIRPLWINSNHSRCNRDTDGWKGLGQDDSWSLANSTLDSIGNAYFWIICVNPSFYCLNTKGKQSIEWHSDHDYDNDSTIDDHSHHDSGYFYLPGAGDDEESWARHLTPTLFWDHVDELLDPTLTDDEVDARIDTVVETSRKEYEEGHPRLNAKESICQSSNRIGELSLWIGSRRSGRPPECWEHFDAILNVTNQEYEGMDAASLRRGDCTDCFYLQLPVEEGKRDKTQLERWMPCGLLFLIIHLQQRRRVLVHCNQGKDRSVAVVVAFISTACRLTFPLRLSTEFYDWDTQWAVAKIDANAEAVREAAACGLSQSAMEQLMQDDAREVVLRWIHMQHDPLETRGETRCLQPLADKERLRIAHHLILQDRSQADPTRCTFQKLNRFFMSSPLYRSS